MEVDPSTIFWSSYAFLWAIFIWDIYLSWRQYRLHKVSTKRPKEVEEIIDEETFNKARSYKLDRELFSFFTDFWGHFQNNVVLLCGLLPIFWNTSGDILSRYNLHGREILQSLVFMVLIGVVTFILELPWKLYSTFVIEEKHGFNKQTLGFFFKDQVKGLLLGLCLGLPITAAIIWIIKSGGPYFFLYLWTFVSLVILFLMTIYPEFIAPLFDKYTPLPPGELRSRIEGLAGKLEFPLKKLFVVEGSKRSAHSNAYLYGLWNNKRIVLYDTLLENYNPASDDVDKKDKNTAGNGEEEEFLRHSGFEKLGSTEGDGDQDKKPEPPNSSGERAGGDAKSEGKNKGCSDDEVVAVIGHELGHWKLGHNVYNIIISEVNLLLCFGVFAVLYQSDSLYTAFGFNNKPTLIGLLIIFQFVFAPYNEILSFLMTVWTRRMEFQADKFSSDLGFAKKLQSALVKLSKDNLSFPVDDWLYSTVHYSHPPTLERVRVLKKFE